MDTEECMANEHTGRGGNTVERILDAATNVFSEFGFAGARVDEIARRGRGTPRRHALPMGNDEAPGPAA